VNEFNKKCSFIINGLELELIAKQACFFYKVTMTRIFRAFSTMELSEGEDQLVLDREESHHLGKVLRVQAGFSVEILDGRGSLAAAEITEVDRNAIRVKILELKSLPPPKPFVRIAVAMTKANRWEEMIRPLTEMGVGHITPLLTERTEVSIPTGKEIDKLAKWRKLAIEACKQSGNPWLPAIDAPVRLDELLRGKDEAVFIASLRLHGLKSLTDLKSPLPESLLIIGPEGGWTEEEECFALENGAVPFYLGPNVLRTETAALCALAVARVAFLD
jgi:16S rRNA (uracil1498-N3)-methyltransferase